MIREGDEGGVQVMEIDETKDITPYRISSELVHSDHCAVRVVMNWRIVCEGSKSGKYVIDIRKLKDCKDRQALVEIARENGPIKQKYTKWQTELDKILRKCKKKTKVKNNKSRVLRDLMRARRSIKKEGKRFISTEKKRIWQVQKKLISEYIIREKMKEVGIRMKEKAAEIKSEGGVNGAAFWDFKKKLDGTKPNNVVAVRSKEGKVIENVEEIKREYEQYYKDLFILDKPKDEISRLADEINLQYQKWMSISGTGKTEKIQKSSIQEVEKAVKNLKNKYTPDSQGINNIIIKSMGTEMTESLALLIGDIEEELNTPDEWEKMKILSLHKKGSKLEFENKRWIFITSNISKVFEKVRMEITKDELNQKISRLQCGGIEGRSTVDHLLTLNAVISCNSVLGAPTYMWFGDAYKCFDKLDLKDCIKEIGKVMGWKDAWLIRKMNENGKAVIRIPAGETDTIDITENVRQGTIYGPKLCSLVTDRVNDLSRKNVTLIRNVAIT
ncbi:uncharacterized protein LOC135212402 [Macrobrachium nipponense]|uniref:uncharacterized protein LOC135212402 n=1 Tax=Macrobrachium nipponense TaxID=159736 RepID=UPI0030C8780F